MRSVLAVALFTAGQAFACGNVPVATAIIGFDSAITLDVTLTGSLRGCEFGVILSGFHYDYVKGSLLVAGQTYTFDQPYPEGLHIVQPVDLGNGSFAVTAKGEVWSSWTRNQYSIGGDLLSSEQWAAPIVFAANSVIVSHAPEPATYAMMLAGLGLLGLRRRNEPTARI